MFLIQIINTSTCTHYRISDFWNVLYSICIYWYGSEFCMCGI